MSPILQEEHANDYLGQKPRQDPYGNTYNPGCTDHPNFSCVGNNQVDNRNNPTRFRNPKPPQHFFQQPPR